MVPEQARPSDDTDLRTAWQRIQTHFVDDPLAAVGSAAGMVGELTEALVTSLQQQERALRGTWEEVRDGQSADQTERLRVLLCDYRDLFSQLTRCEPGTRVSRHA